MEWSSELSAVVICGLVGGAIHLDRTAAFQIMVSRPIVAGPLTGWLLGDVNLGLLVGILMELLWINYLPMGSFIPPNETFATIVASGTVCLYSSRTGTAAREVVMLGVLLTVPMAYAGRYLDILARRCNVLWTKRADQAASGKGRLGQIVTLHFMGLLTFYGIFSIAIMFFLILYAEAVTAIYPLLSPEVLNTLRLLYALFPMIGFAVLLTMHKEKKSLFLFFLLCLVFIGVKGTFGFIQG